ncbi:MAG: hypothetical protein GXP08_16255 [Gammaproteobacteria bacterium]|nr:hypothetical protein [Gammaproteobacteria bacterium]
MENIHYFSIQVYQNSHAWPLYREVGGEFLVPNLKRWLQFKRYMRNGNLFPEKKTFLNTPPVSILNIKKPININGVVLSLSTVTLEQSSKNCITVFVGHGTGDKRYPGNEAKKQFDLFDYLFVSGPKHLEKLKDTGIDVPEEKRIKIGNLRFDDYVNRRMDASRIMRNLGIIDTNRKNILYAPTWRWGNGTLLKYAIPFSQSLSSEYNLIIRPHAHDRMHVAKLRTEVKKRGLQHVYFSMPSDLLNHDTFDDFYISDLLISDTSSIIYEYLITQKPLIVIDNGFSEGHDMPAEYDISSIVKYYDESMDVLALVTDTLAYHDPMEHGYCEMLHNCFYFNDGKSIGRAVEFLENINSSRFV